ncbi:nucleotide pyrophosphohydrolase [Gordonia sp. HNM0687]|uniref:Nucleotide pyrophosphohydrolase n=1 Tax=Gordonia mangrovi TaxID=2665643 RepID=A0A6L7GTY8_9ACTN|nr:MazG family protein [Gordonia mangrovi]MXP22917.1 nucleotide pyrophosphohydrolase [Gordonia mangrovi]UVF77218.1 MazG family protein [Gordonia mangrovi]
MTVILLDPLRPDTIPTRAVPLLSGPLAVTEDIHPTTLWGLGITGASWAEHDDPGATLLSSDRAHRFVLARMARGEDVIGAAPVPGDALLESVALMDTLRRNGPWESTQTHASLRRYLLEECYELLDAIDDGDHDLLREELGDLLLQVLFHARIAADHPDHPFDIDDVARSFTAKVRGRTPGILSGAHADLDTQIREWEERKAAEKARGSVLDGVATTAPALALAQKVLERLDAAGFPMDRVDPDLTRVSVQPGGDSAEEIARQRVRRLMSQIRCAEQRAQAEGLTLADRDSWLSVFHEAGETGAQSTVTSAQVDGDHA